MTNTKVQVGDLIRITDSEDASKGRIYEVTGTNEYGDAYVDDKFENGGQLYFCDDEYVIHSKTGEEDAAPTVGDVIGNITKLRNEVVQDCKPQDAVVQPNHYTQGKFETIEVIEEITKGYSDGFTSYCVGNALKYEARAPFKHSSPIEDLRKAARYLEYAIAHEQRKIDGK